VSGFGRLLSSFFDLNSRHILLGKTWTEALIVLMFESGASGRTRTCNLLIRSQKLYPIELPTLESKAKG
jgi:hypothetical protein